MTDSGEEVVLADRLRTKSEVAAVRIAEQERAERERHDAERERLLASAAQEWFANRTEHLPDLLEAAAAQGKFEWKVWSEVTSQLNDDAREYHARGFAMLVDWLTERGFEADLVAAKHPGQRTILTARWDDRPAWLSPASPPIIRGETEPLTMGYGSCEPSRFRRWFTRLIGRDQSS